MFATSPCAADAGITLRFPYLDDALLASGQHDGGTVYVTPGYDPDTPSPVLVMLHGLNAEGVLHPWTGGAKDLRPIADRLVRSGAVRPFILAAPSQTKRAAHADTLFSDFDLPGFLDDAELAMCGAASFDRGRTVVVGHSGAGCSTKGGLLSVAAARIEPAPIALVPLDTCQNRELGVAFAVTDPRSFLWITWQNQSWKRDFSGFRHALLDGAVAERSKRTRFERVKVASQTPHDDIVPLVFERVVRNLFAGGGGVTHARSAP